MSLETFFKEVRSFFPRKRLTKSQVENIKVIIDTWQREYPDQPDNCLAYLLATAFHETAHRMEPIKEYGSKRRANRLYGVEGSNPSRARKMGNTMRGDGARYMGRGYVQLTWKTNYKKLGEHVGLDLVKKPNLALEPEIAAQALVYGCMSGMYTGKELTDYCNESKTDFVNARGVVNGTDKAKLIAGHAENFLEAIEEAGGVSELSTNDEIKTEKPPKEERKPLTKSRTIFDLILTFISGFGSLISNWWETIKKVYDAAQDPISMVQSIFGQVELNTTTILIILALTGLAISAYAKVDDNKNGEVA